MSGDELVNMGYLRVPFRRIPRRRINNRNELEAIGQTFDAGSIATIYWRGQDKEYLLDRDAATAWLLYGDPHALEPSLLTSAGRAGIDWETILPVWSPIVRAHLDANPKLHGLTAELYRSYRLRGLLLALAQHYGLPSAWSRRDH